MKSTLILLAFLGSPLSHAALTIGDVIFNEYSSDNIGTDPTTRDFFELLIVANGADLRGLRVSDNELTSSTGALNNNESVIIFGNHSFFEAVPAGTLITIWIAGTGTGPASGITTDTVASFAANDWSMSLTSGTGITISDDGLTGSTSAGLSASGDALYLYLPGGDGNSGGTDNIYLDFISWEIDNAVAPDGLFDINLTSVADNAYYTGNTVAGNDTVANWTKDDGPDLGTPGAPNTNQDLSALRAIPEPASSLLSGLGILCLLRRRR